MKFIVSILFMLFSMSVNASTEYKNNMLQKLAVASSPENVKVTAFKQKMAYCFENTKNKGLVCDSYVNCSKQEAYLKQCLNDNDAQRQYAAINTNFNDTLKQNPTAAGNADMSTGIKRLKSVFKNFLDQKKSAPIL